MGWLIKTLNLAISFSTLQLQKFQVTLALTPQTQCRTSIRKWAHLVGVLRSIAPDLPRVRGVLYRPRAVLLDNQGRLSLSSEVHADLQDWGQLI